jgi:hypothetical protein
MAEKKYFKCVVEGQYHALHENAGTPTLRKYSAEFTLPSQEAALSVICKHLLTPYLEKKYPDFIRFRTHELKSITLVGYTPDPSVLQIGIDEMSVKELSDFCILRQILIDPYKYPDLERTKEIVAEMWRTKRQEKTDEKVTEAEDAINDLLSLNELDIPTKELKVNLNEQKASLPKMPAAPGKRKPEFVDPLDEILPGIVDDNADAAIR